MLRAEGRKTRTKRRKKEERNGSEKREEKYYTESPRRSFILIRDLFDDLNAGGIRVTPGDPLLVPAKQA